MLRVIAWAAILSMASPALSSPPTVDRSIGKQPEYLTKTPRYLLLLIGPERRDRAWFVLDGNTLYVDRNGNGDLTDPDEKITGKAEPGDADGDRGYKFEIGDLSIGGMVHKQAAVYTTPVKHYSDGAMANRPEIRAAMANDPQTPLATVLVDIVVGGMKGGGSGGRVSFRAGSFDINGALFFGDSPATAPVVHVGGPLQITFCDELPTMRLGRKSDFVLFVGTPGIGPGSFSMVLYEDTIPESAKPLAEIEYSPEKPGDTPIREKHELKHRC